MLIDTHCHLDDPRFAGRVPGIIDDCRRCGVTEIIVPGVIPSAWNEQQSLVDSYEGVHAAFGVHPQHAHTVDDGTYPVLHHHLHKAVAVGEIGLDYTAGLPERNLQIRVFREQVRLAVGLGLPVILHCRRAFSDLLTILKEERIERTGGVMHSFSGSLPIAAECIRLGLYISISGTVTYHNAIRPPEIARLIPLDRLLLETDAPDITPEPYRGRFNEPAFLPAIARKVAELRGVTLAEAAERTTENAERLFRLR